MLILFIKFFVELHLKQETSYEADSIVEKKSYADHALILEILIFSTIPMKPKVDIFTTIPLSLLANFLFVRASYTIEDENMACFADPQNFADSKLLKQ